MPRRHYLLAALLALAACATPEVKDDSAQFSAMPGPDGLPPEALPGPDALAVNKDLPDALTNGNGDKITSPAAWESRRGEMKKTLEWYATGTMPPAPGNTRGEVLKAAAFEDGVKYELVHLSFGKDSKEGFDAALFTPKGDGPFPCFIYLAFDATPGAERLPLMPRRPEQGKGLDAFTLPLGLPEPPKADDGRNASGTIGTRPAKSPAEFAKQYHEVFERGYAIMMFHYQDAGEDNIARLEDKSWAFRHTRFVADYPDYDWGLLGCWAWGASRCVDYLETRADADSKKLIAIGHSRLGKAVLVAGAFDERLAMVVPAGSAGGGVGAYRFAGENGSETLDVMVKKYPNWYSPRLRDFSGKRERLPFDQHWFAALTAPRAFFPIEGLDDKICSAYATRMSFEGAAPVYKLLGAPENLGVHYSDHGHALTVDDWGVAMDFADKALRGKKSDEKFDQWPDKAYPERWSENPAPTPAGNK